MAEEGYQVIARRWRPRQFDEVVGQDHIVRTLKNAIEQDRIAHAYLFVGPRGTGKTSTARIFAKALNAEGGPNAAPKDDTETARAIMAGSCMDVIEIDGASNNSVDQVRDLREDCTYAPANCRYKIYIIDEVHMLSGAAFNALLKTLEEPPGHVKFIFATTEAQKVLPTIVSRCQRFEFRPISEEQIAERLALIAKEEALEVEEGALRGIARMASGGMRDAQSILDQMISFCGEGISEKAFLEVYGLASPEQVRGLAGCLASGDYAGLLEAIERLAGEGRDLYRVLSDLQEMIRATLLDAIGNGGTSAKLGAELSTEALLRMLETLQKGEGSVRTGLSERVNFEVLLMKAIEQSRVRAIDTVIQKLAGIAPEGGEKKKPVAPEPPGRKTPTAAAAADDGGGTGLQAHVARGPNGTGPQVPARSLSSAADEVGASGSASAGSVPEPEPASDAAPIVREPPAEPEGAAVEPIEAPDDAGAGLSGAGAPMEDDGAELAPEYGPAPEPPPGYANDAPGPVHASKRPESRRKAVRLEAVTEEGLEEALARLPEGAAAVFRERFNGKPAGVREIAREELR
jgi:DNA polymerase-3 subunit gamma/tau